MLRRPGASTGVFGWSKALWADRRAVPSPVSVAKAESFVAVDDQVNVNVNDNYNAGERERDYGSCE
jgi:hypothetical protein